MIETITVITLCVLYLVFFRPGKTPLLEKPLLIERPGRYRITLAPKLNLAQPFIESVASRISVANEAIHSSAVQFFAVRDKQVATLVGAGFLLVIGYRNGMLYFQAEQPPQGGCNHHGWLAKFTEGEWLSAPAMDEHSLALGSCIISAIQNVARETGVDVNLLHVGGTTIRQQPLNHQNKPFDFCG